jgi:hypothetical protein
MLVLAVDTHLLWQVIWVSVLAGVAISALFSLVILGVTRASDARREGSSTAPYVALAVVAFALFAAGVALGVQEMISK